MSGGSLLGVSVLELRTDQRALDAGLAGARRKADMTGAEMQRTMDRRMMSMGSSMSRVGGQLTRYVSAPLAALGLGAADFAQKFEQAMEMVHTQAGASQREVDALRGKVLALAKTLPQSPQQLAMGLYHLESIGLRGAKAMDALKVAAQGAAVGNASLEDTATALGSAWLVNIKGAGDLHHTMGVLNAAVGAGNMRMNDLVDALGTGVLPAAKIAGLSLRDVAGAIAVLSDEGTGASQAANLLRTSLHFLYDPSAKAEKALKSIGLNADKMGTDLRQPNGLLVALGDLRDHLGKLSAVNREQLLGDIFPAGRGWVLQTLMNQLDRYGQKLGQIDRTSRNFSQDVAATQRTSAYKIHAAWSTLEADAIQLGQRILPDLLAAGQEIVGDVDHVARAFTSLPKSAQDAILTGGLVLAGIGPAMKLLGLFTVGLGRLWQVARIAEGLAVGRGLAAFGRGPSVPGVSGAGGMVSTMQVGTIEAGEIIARGMAGGGGGWPLMGSKTGAKPTPGTPLGSEQVSVAPSLVSRGLQGLTIAGLGVAIAQTVGAGIHGGVGGAVKSIGTDAAIGAGFGAIFGPAGIAGGAIAGGLVGTLTHFIHDDALKQGRDFADRFLAPLPAALRDKYGGALAQAVVDAHTTRATLNTLQSGTRLPEANAGATRGGIIRPGRLVQQRDLTNFYFNQGWVAGQAVKAGLDSVRDPSAPVLIRDFIGRLRMLPPQARTEAAKVMLEYAESLARSGRLPRRAVDGIVASIEQAFPGLRPYLVREGIQTDQGLASALRFTAATSQLKQTLAGYRQQFGDWAISTKLTETNVNDNTAMAMRHLHDIIVVSTGQTRKDAVAELHRLQNAVGSTFDAMSEKVAAAAGDMRKSVTSGSQQAYKIGSANWSNFAKAIGESMASGVISAQTGMKLITDALNQTLKALGEKPLSITTVKGMTAAQLQAVASGRVSSGGAASPHAMGGWVGNPGERGRDLVPVVVGRGEAILKHQDQAIVNQALALTPYGSLAGVFSANAGQKHYMASGGYAGGGFVADPGTNFSVGQEPAITSRLAALARSLGITIYGISGYRSPAHSIAVGGFPNDPHTRGEAADIGVNSSSRVSAAQLSNAILARFGLYRPFDPSDDPNNPEVNHIQLLAGAKIGAALGAALGALAPSIRAPSVAGRGAVADIVRGALRKVTGAANAFVGSHVGAAGNISGAGIGGAGGAKNLGGLERLWVQAGGPPELAHIMAAIAMAESGGRNVIQQGQPYSTTGWGLWQITPGNSEPQAGVNQALLNPLANARAAVAKWRAGGLGQWTTYTSGRYAPFMAGGGFAGGFATDAARRRAPRSAGHGAKFLSLGDLTAAGGTVAGLESGLTSLLAQYTSLSGRFAADEADPKYLNADGSLNAAGIAKKTTDDQLLLAIEQQILGDYQAELGPVTGALTTFLGKRSATATALGTDQKRLAKNKLKEAGIRAALNALAKPKADSVGALQIAIRAIRAKYDPAIHAAQKARGLYHGTNRAHRKHLQDAVTTARGNEDTALAPVQRELVHALILRKRHADKVKGERARLNARLGEFTHDDLRITQNETRLRGILSGSGGQQGENTTISALETVAGKLGTPIWSASGKFVGIDTTNQGAAFDAQTTVNQLKATVAQDQGLTASPSTAPAIDNSALYQSRADSDALLIGVLERQYKVLSALPPFGGSFLTGGIVPGPIGAARTIIAHGGEPIYPVGGGPDVKVRVEDHRVRVWVDEVEQIVDRKLRHTSRHAGRPLPGRGGGR